MDNLKARHSSIALRMNLRTNRGYHRYFMSVSALSDANLAVRCRAGDQIAWEELVDRYSRYVWAIAVQAFRFSETDAEELTQDVFTRVYQRLDTLRSDEALRPWIGQLTRRMAIDKIRARRDEVLTDEPPEPAVTDATLEKLDLAMDVRGAMTALSDMCGEVLDRFFTRDQSYETIGEQLEIPAGTIASRISRCLTKLREALEARETVGQ